jgi:hypothetical protein
MITPAALAQLALDLGRATFDNTYDSLATIQTMAEDAVVDFLRRAAWVPEPLKAVCGEYVGLLRRTRQDVRQTVDRCYLLLGARGPENTEELGPPPSVPARTPLALVQPARAGARRA